MKTLRTSYVSGCSSWLLGGSLCILLAGKDANASENPTAPNPSRARCTIATPTLDEKLDQVEKLRTAQRFADAENAIAPFVATYPDTFRVLHLGALVRADVQDWDGAKKLLKQAIAVQTACGSTTGYKPDYAVYNTLGWVNMCQGEWAEAERNFNFALAHSDQLTQGTRAKTQANLGALFFSRGEFEKARPLLQQAILGGSSYAQSVLDQVDRAQTIYQQKADAQFYVVALTSMSLSDLQNAASKVKGNLGSEEFNRRFPDIQFYRPNQEFQYTLLLNSAPVGSSQAKQLRAAAIEAGFSKDTWLMPARDPVYFPVSNPPAAKP